MEFGWYHPNLEIVIPTLDKSDSERNKQHAERNHHKLV